MSLYDMTDDERKVEVQRMWDEAQASVAHMVPDKTPVDAFKEGVKQYVTQGSIPLPGMGLPQQISRSEILDSLFSKKALKSSPLLEMSHNSPILFSAENSKQLMRQIEANAAALGKGLQRIPDSVLDYVNKVEYMPIGPSDESSILQANPRADWGPVDKTIRVSPVVHNVKIDPEGYKGINLMFGHESGHVGAQLLRDIVGKEDRRVVSYYPFTKRNISNSTLDIETNTPGGKSLKLSLPRESLEYLYANDILFPYETNQKDYPAYRSHPEEKLAAGVGINVADLTSTEIKKLEKSRYPYGEPRDRHLGRLLFKLLQEAK